MPISDVFPALHCCTKLSKNARLYDVKFYPYPTDDDDQIFAVAGEKDVFICRPTLNSDSPFELLRWFKQEDRDTSINSLVWTKDPVTRKPILCVAGEKPKQIQILDIDTGRPIRSLVGHGKGINDLAISPLSTNILASASEDYEIRLWNLRPEYAAQPCVAMFCGEGHRQPTLAIHFHPNGRWMLSGGLDTTVCLWAVPPVEELDPPTEVTQDDLREPKTVYYPHFHSTEVHPNYVDCLAFYGDLIISRAARHDSDRKPNEILLWRIEGFDPDDTNLPPAPIPHPGVHTRSAFPHSTTTSRGFQRLLTFQMPQTHRFYQRFGLLHNPGMHPILCMGNHESKFFFWDLQRLEEGWDPTDDKVKKKTIRKTNKTGVSSENLNRLDDLRTAPSGPSSEGTGGATRTRPQICLQLAMCTNPPPPPAMPSSTSNSGPPDRKSALSDNFLPLKAHAVITPKTSLSPKRHFSATQMAWSPDGTWLVGVGDFGMMCIFHRDASVVNGVQRPAETPVE